MCGSIVRFCTCSSVPGGIRVMRKSFGFLVIAVACAATLGFSGSATRAAAACMYAPVLRGYTITQGIGSYAVLARNKETLVRLYLSGPDCAARGSDVKLR